MTRIVIVREKPSRSAVLLAEELRGRGINAVKLSRRSLIREDDKVVWWGGETRLDKLEELQALKDADVPTVDFALPGEERTDGVWLARSKYHTQGLDLSNPPRRPDYWVRKENIESELRVHIWRGLSIRAGVKVRTDSGGEADGSWIRAHRLGWSLSYVGTRPPVRDLARRAVAAVGSDFAAVDIAYCLVGEQPSTGDEDQEPSGSADLLPESWLGVDRVQKVAKVLEVNRAPGLDERTVVKYADQIVRELEDA